MTSRKVLWIVILNFVLAGLVLQKVSTQLFLAGKVPAACNGTVIHDLRDLVKFDQADDSRRPMTQALQARNEPAGIYQTIFFDRKIKFQYPLSSLIPLYLLQRAGFNEMSIALIWKILSGIAVLGTMSVVIAIAKPRDIPIALVIACSFTPLIRAYSLGQIQVFIDLIFAISFLLWQKEREFGRRGFGIDCAG